MKDKRWDDALERLEILETTVATQAKIHVQVQQHIAAVNAAGQNLTQKSFLQSQQLSVTHRKIEEMEKRTTEVEELTGVLEREANDLRVDGNAYRNEIAGLSQRVDHIYQVLQMLSGVLTSEVAAEE